MRECLREALVVLAALAFVRPAEASSTYPQALQQALNMPCAPPCTICHTDLNGGLGTVTRPFGNTMRAQAGLVPIAPESIPAALDALEGDTCAYSVTQPPQPGPCDSNGDGVPDVTQLAAGRDPNTGVDLCSGDAGSDSGCGVARNSGSVDWLALALAGLVAAALARRVRRSTGG